MFNIEIIQMFWRRSFEWTSTTTAVNATQFTSSHTHGTLSTSLGHNEVSCTHMHIIYSAPLLCKHSSIYSGACSGHKSRATTRYYGNQTTNQQLPEPSRPLRSISLWMGWGLSGPAGSSTPTLLTASAYSSSTSNRDRDFEKAQQPNLSWWRLW